MKRINPILALLAVLCLGLAFAACGSDDESSSRRRRRLQLRRQRARRQRDPAVDGADGKTITIGSKNFTEQFILGEIYSQALEAAGFTVKKQLNLGSELIAHKALQSGKIDAYPEYTGTALTSFFGVKTTDVPRDADEAYEKTKEGFAKENITALPQTPFENTFRLGMTKETNEKLGGIKTTSELKGKEKRSVDLRLPRVQAA